jgi:hypothetical protein
MLAGAEHSCPMLHLKSILLMVPSTHYATSKALKLESVSPLYHAHHGDLDAADARVGAYNLFCNHTTMNIHNKSETFKERTHRAGVGPLRSCGP